MQNNEERAGNRNRIQKRGFSNPATRALYSQQCAASQRSGRHRTHKQCGGCSFYAVFNSDWGLCCHAKSRHYLETVFEHFSCQHAVFVSWEAHCFTEKQHTVSVEYVENNRGNLQNPADNRPVKKMTSIRPVKRPPCRKFRRSI